MENKENKEDKMDIASNEHSTAAKNVLKESQNRLDKEPEQPLPKKTGYAYLSTRLDSIETRIHALGDKINLDTRGMMKKCFRRKENTPMWSGNEVVASAISKVRKIRKSDGSDLEDSIDWKASKIPKLENPEPIASTSNWIASEVQAPLEESSFEGHDNTMTLKSIPIWESRPFRERQKDVLNVTDITSSSMSSISTCDTSESTLTAAQIENPEELTSAFSKLTTQCLVPHLKSPEEGTNAPISAKTLARNLFNTTSEQDLSTLSSNHELSGIEPIFEDFSSFSDFSFDHVGVSAEDLAGSTFSTTLDSSGGERFVHSTPLRQSIRSRVAELERQLFETDDENVW